MSTGSVSFSFILGAGFSLYVAKKVRDNYMFFMGRDGWRYIPEFLSPGDFLSVKEYITPGPFNEIVSRVATGVAIDQNTLSVWDVVARDISYQSDVGMDDWSFPVDTWEAKYGDCEDSSFLLCSMMRNLTENVWVAAGKVGDDPGKIVNHAWVVTKMPEGDFILESTFDGVPENPWLSVQDAADAYVPYMYWNDKEIMVRTDFVFGENLGQQISESDKYQIIRNVWDQKGQK